MTLTAYFKWCIAVCVITLTNTFTFATDIVLPATDNQGQYTLTLETMKVVFTDTQGNDTTLSEANNNFGAFNIIKSNNDADKKWTYNSPKTTVIATVATDGLRVTFQSNPTGQEDINVTFPIITETESDQAWTLPIFEGIYVDKQASHWRKKLTNIEGDKLTEALTMPSIGLMGASKMRIVIFEDQYSNRTYCKADDNEQLTFTITHNFNRLQKNKKYTVLFQIRDNDLLGAAKAYRENLIARGQFLSLQDKIKTVPHASRMIGAVQAYVWGEKLVYGDDLNAKQCNAFAKRILKAENDTSDKPAAWLWEKLNETQRNHLREIAAEQWVSLYARNNLSEIIDQLARDTTIQSSTAFLPYLRQNAEADPERTPIHKIAEANMDVLQKAFGQLFANYRRWGSGISTRMIDQLKAAGIEKAHLSTGGLHSTSIKPWVAEAAAQAGYLYGPYDSYHSAHRPDMNPESTWDTAQFDWAAYNDGAIMRKDGTLLHGFKKIGHKLSPLYAKPYVEKRVNEVTSQVPHNSWFVDCDAFGEVYDDWNPKHEASQETGAIARLERLQWLSDKKNLVVGSEGGASYAAAAILFSHGMITPVIGWGDPLHKDRKSKYYLGRWYPENGPEIFMKQVPLQQKYIDLYYNPAVRLPLFEAAFHDSVISSHHWSNGTLKYHDVDKTIMLIEILYNVPPMYHFNPAQFAKQKDSITKHAAMFKKVHEQTWNKPLTNLTFLSKDKLIQQSQFDDMLTVTVNFDTSPRNINQATIPAQSVLITFNTTGEQLIYTP